MRSLNCFLFLIGFNAAFGGLRIKLSTGWIEGIRKTASYSPFGNQTANCFLGIPYAKPPTGELRFRKAQRVLPWDGILEAKEYKPACQSNPKLTNKYVDGPISEDCLYLNVFTNDHCQLYKNCSVFVLVHGGQFRFGSASMYDPHILINNFVGQDRNIVVVTINYRLGVFGFNHLFGDENDNELNLGIRDTIDSLKWVQREIRAFGGDPLKVTLGGHSAGAIIVVYTGMTNLSEGLYRSQIIMSAPLELLSTKQFSLTTRKIAKDLGCFSSSFNETYECMRKIDEADLIASQLKFEEPLHTLVSIDNNVVRDDSRFVRNPLKLSTMIGSLTAERRSSAFLQDSNGRAVMAKLKKACEFIGFSIFELPQNFVQECFKYYGRDNFPQFMIDDFEFYAPLIQIADTQASQGSDVFVYSYDYKKAGKAFRSYDPKKLSPRHTEDLIYSLGINRNSFTEKDYEIEKIYSGMFADFINHNHPMAAARENWQTWEARRRNYYLIDFDGEQGTRENFGSRAHNFWNLKAFSCCGEMKRNATGFDFPPWMDSFVMLDVLNLLKEHGDGKKLKQMEQLINEKWKRLSM